MKKFALFLMLACSVTLFAADRHWDGGGADDYWTTAANWTQDIVPVSGDRIYIDESGETVIVPADQTVYPTKIIGPSNTASGTITLNVNGELYNPSYWYMGRSINGQGILNVHGYVKTRDLYVAPGNGYSGTVNIDGGELWVYGDGESMGAFFGSTYADNVFSTTTGTATINVANGIIRITNLHTIGINSFINISNGQLLLAGDKTSLVASCIESNQIRAFDGAGIIYSDYNTLNPGYTTVYAYSGLEAMIDQATAGSILYIPDGVYYESQFDIDKAITIKSLHGPENVIINLLGNGIGVTADNVVVDGLTIKADGAVLLLNIGKSVSGTVSQINNCTIQNCLFDGNANADGICVFDCNDVNLFSNEVIGCLKGIYISNLGRNLRVIDNDIFNNNFGVYVAGSAEQTSLISNGIYWNTSYGLTNISGIPINAENNYWGSDTGPYHPILNLAGTGNNISNNIDFDPYFTGCGDDRWHICPHGDMNADCKIDYQDLAILAENWLVCNGPDCH